MSALPITYNIDETMNQLAARATAEPAIADQFFLKVYRRRQQFQRASEHIATFNGASTVHFAQAEAWLPGLFGGGDYELYAFDPADPGKKIGGMITASYPQDGNPSKVKPDYKQLSSGSWRGPRGLVFPSMEDAAAAAAAAGVSYTPAVGASQVQGQSGQPGAAQVVPDWVVRERQQAEERTRQLELQLERERAERRAAEEASKMRAEMDRMRADSEQRARELEARLVAAQSQKPAGPDIATTAIGILGALGPIVMKMFESSADQRKMDAARADAALAAQQATLARLAEPRGMPPEVTMLFEVMKGQATASGEMMSRMVEATSAFNGMATSMIETMAQHLGGQEGNPILDGAKDIIKTLASMQKGTEMAGRRQAQQMVQAAHSLPASQPQFPTAQHMPQQIPHQPAANATATGPQVPVQSATPAPIVATASPSGFAGLPPVGPQDTVAAIEGMIRNHNEPGQVVDYIIQRIGAKDQALFGALDAHGGDVEALIGDRLGGWALIKENSIYLDQLGDAWSDKASAAGLLEEERAQTAEEAAEA